jgi:hypothetical protein
LRWEYFGGTEASAAGDFWEELRLCNFESPIQLHDNPGIPLTPQLQHGSYYPHIPRGESPRSCQHCPTQLPSKASQGTSREPERVPAARDGTILLQSAIRRNPTTGCDYMPADYTAVPTVRPWTLRIGCLQRLMDGHFRCAGGLTVETTTWEPIRIAAEEAQKKAKS